MADTTPEPVVEEATPVEAPAQPAEKSTYFFPEHELSVVAATLEEAMELLGKALKKVTTRTQERNG